MWLRHLIEFLPSQKEARAGLSLQVRDLSISAADGEVGKSRGSKGRIICCMKESCFPSPQGQNIFCHRNGIAARLTSSLSISPLFPISSRWGRPKLSAEQATNHCMMRKDGAAASSLVLWASRPRPIVMRLWSQGGEEVCILKSSVPFICMEGDGLCCWDQVIITRKVCLVIRVMEKH